MKNNVTRSGNVRTATTVADLLLRKFSKKLIFTINIVVFPLLSFNCYFHHRRSQDFLWGAFLFLKKTALLFAIGLLNLSLFWLFGTQSNTSKTFHSFVYFTFFMSLKTENRLHFQQHTRTA